MIVKLLRPCAALWIVGLVVMWYARAVLVLEPHALLFRIAAGLWILGGFGYTGLALLGLLGEHVAHRERPSGPADPSTWIRRR